MLAVTLLQVAVVVVTAAVLVLCAAFAVMETRRIQNADQFRFAATVGRPPQAPIRGELVQPDPAPSISLVDHLVDSMTKMSVDAVRAELPLAS